MGIIFILLSVSSSLLIAHFLKHTESYFHSTLNVLTVNYMIAVIVAGGINIGDGLSVIPDFSGWFWLFTMLVGIFFVANFFLLSKSVHQNGVGVSIAAMRVSLLIPVLVSILVYGEIITLTKISGILLVFVAILLLVSAQRDIRLTGVGNHWLLLALFLFTGFTEGSMKIYEEEMSSVASEAHFMSAVFFFALLVGGFAALKKGELQKMNRREFYLGMVVGVPNLLASIFLIKAFAYFDASVVYSTINMLVVIGGALIGLIFWKDKVSPKEWAGMSVAIIAIILLTGF